MDFYTKLKTMLSLKRVGGLVKVDDGNSVCYINPLTQNIEFVGTDNDAFSVIIGGTTHNFVHFSDIEIDGVAVTDEDDFDSKIISVFPNVNSGSGGSGSSIIGFTTNIPFDKELSVMPETHITGPLVFSINNTNAEIGNGTMVRIIADGMHAPDLTAFAVDGYGSVWNNNAGVINKLFFYYDGTDYCVSITQIVQATTTATTSTTTTTTTAGTTTTTTSGATTTTTTSATTTTTTAGTTTTTTTAGSSAVPINFSVVGPDPVHPTLVQVSPGLWQADDVSNGYSHYGASTQKLPAGVSGGVYCKLDTSLNLYVLLGLHTAPIAASFATNATTWRAGVFMSSSTPIAIENGNQAASGANVTLPTYIGLFRDGSDGTLTIRTSADAIDWSNIVLALTIKENGDLYPVANVPGSSSGGQLLNPMCINFV